LNNKFIFDEFIFNDLIEQFEQVTIKNKPYFRTTPLFDGLVNVFDYHTLKPGESIEPHIDHWRNASLNIPILHTKNILSFYEDNQVIFQYEVTKPFVMNGKIKHGAQNTDVIERKTLSWSFEQHITFEKAKELICNKYSSKI
jgi:hypothetical protein